MGRVALDRLDQVRHQVVAALELDVDPGPRLVDAVARTDHRVACEQPVEAEQHHDPDDDVEDNHF